MRSKFFVLLSACLLVINLAACSDGGAALSVAESTAAAEAADASFETEDLSVEEETYAVDIPKAVQNLSEEDDILLNGELKDGVYTNQYFGFKFSVPEGGTMIRDYDSAAETKDIIPLKKAYEEEWGGLSYSAVIPGIDGYVSIIISALKDDELGLDEEALVKKNIQDIWDINKVFDEEEGPELRTFELAGEEHPASYDSAETGDDTTTNVTFYIPKGDFQYVFYISVINADVEEIIQYFEKL